MHQEQLKPDTYIDIHSHLRLSSHEELKVYVLSPDELLGNTSESRNICAGIHPWWLEEIDEGQIVKLQKSIHKFLEDGRLWAIGETGIDRLYPEFLDKQKELFNWHIELSEKYQKPLVIHNVRAGSDILEILKDKRPQMPWLFHDFRGNLELVKSLLGLHQNCYFSFGISLDNSQSIRELIRVMPIDKIFFETDAQKHLDIHDVYIRACKELKIDLADLKKQIYKNYISFIPSLH